MLLQDLGFALVRRWYFVLCGIAISAAGVFGLYQVVPITYQATASAVLVPPQTAVIEGENPYLYMGALDQALSVLTVKMNSAEVSEPILHKDPDLSYTLTKDVSTTGPIIIIESDAPVDETALSIVNQVLEKVPPNLVEIQDALGVPKNARITVMTIVQDHEAEEVTKKQQRTVIAGGAAGLAITILSTGLLDKILTKRKKKKQAKKLSGAPTNEDRIENIGDLSGQIELVHVSESGKLSVRRPSNEDAEPEGDGPGPSRVTQSSLIES